MELPDVDELYPETRNRFPALQYTKQELEIRTVLAMQHFPTCESLTVCTKLRV